jgi:hypothetical protein
MATRDDKHWKVLPHGTFAGKRITFAATDEVEASPEVASEFMFSIFALDPGDYAMSDESDILDFMPFDERSTNDVWSRITQLYGVTLSDVGSGRLVDVFRAITARRGTQ